jgi:hypothetical protein
MDGQTTRRDILAYYRHCLTVGAIRVLRANLEGIGFIRQNTQFEMGFYLLKSNL